MTDCHICYRHHPNDDDGCTDRCRHIDATVGNLCSRCHLRLLDDLDLLADAVALAAPVHQSGARVRSSFASRPPVSTDWLDWLRGNELRDVLESWARVIHEDNPDLPWPRTRNADLLAWLRQRAHDVLPAHEAVAVFAEEIRPWARRSRRVLGDLPQGQVIGCPDCDARLRVDIVAKPDSIVACPRCAWSGTAAWAINVVLNDPHTQAFVDIEVISTWLGCHPDTVRRWAKAGKVATRNRRPIRYSLADVKRIVGAP